MKRLAARQIKSVAGMFADRKAAGIQLSDLLLGLNLVEPIIFGIPRGGVIVAREVADRLGAPLDVIVPAKIRAPRQPELGLGAVAPDGTTYLDAKTIEAVGVSSEYLQSEIEARKAEILRRMHLYRGTSDFPTANGRTAVIVDDGIATGGTAVAAARSVARMNPAQVILAVPVAPRATIEKVRSEVDQIVCLSTPEPFVAVGAYFQAFTQVTDDEVHAALSGGRGV